MMVLDKEDGRWRAGVPTPRAPAPPPRRAGTHTPGHGRAHAGLCWAGGAGGPQGAGDWGGEARELWAARPRGRARPDRTAGGRATLWQCDALRGRVEAPAALRSRRSSGSRRAFRLCGCSSHRSHHPRAARVTREALSAEQISGFGKSDSRFLRPAGAQKEGGHPGARQARGKAGTTTGDTAAQKLSEIKGRLLCCPPSPWRLLSSEAGVWPRERKCPTPGQ